jgi:hypothetical protein
MRLSVAVLTGTLVTGSLMACSNGYSVPQTPSISADGSASKMSVAPVELRSSAILAKIHAAAGHGRADAVTPGIYASFGTPSPEVLGYSGSDSSNGPPVCSVNAGGVSNIAVDRQGDLIVPAGDIAKTITVFAGPGLCGRKLGTIATPYYPSDVASRNAANGGKIVAANPPYCCPYHPRTGISVCTLSGGCTAELFAGHMEMYDVALAPNGDCWATGFNRPSRSPALAYFAGCRHNGVIATGFLSGSVRDIDDNGNLVVISGASGTSQLYIYSGCNPSCKLVGGPFQLKSGGFGHLDANSKHLVVADTAYSPFHNQLDVYSYSTTGIKYEYSISNGLPQYTTVYGAAFSPPSKE